MELSRKDFVKGQKAQRGFKDDVSSGEMRSLKAQKHFSPPFACQKFHRGANSGSTWGWILLEGAKKPEDDLLV